MERLRGELDELRKVAEAKEGELFETNFELQGAQRNLKLVTAENDELEARLEETYQVTETHITLPVRWCSGPGGAR